MGWLWGRISDFFASSSHFAERGCVRSTSRSAWMHRTAWCYNGVLRLVGNRPAGPSSVERRGSGKMGE